jgi:hypothetical protein
VKHAFEVSHYVSWQAEIDTAQPEWAWLESYPPVEWPRVLSEVMEHDYETYETFAKLANGPWDGPSYTAKPCRLGEPA